MGINLRIKRHAIRSSALILTSGGDAAHPWREEIVESSKSLTQRDHLKRRRRCWLRASIPNLFVCWQHKIVLDVVVSKILIGADQNQELSFLFGRCEIEKDFVSVGIRVRVTKKCQGSRVGEMRIGQQAADKVGGVGSSLRIIGGQEFDGA